MTSRSEHTREAQAIRLRIASDLGASYATVPAVVAVFVGGSVARGWADGWSDLELGVVWTAPPTEQLRRDGLVKVPIARHRSFPDHNPLGALEEEFIAGGVKVDVAHMAAAAVESVIRDVTETGDADIAKQALLATLLVAVPLHGHAIIETWQSRIAQYPDGLSRAMVAKHLAFGPHDYLTMLAERGDLLLLSDILCRVARSILGVLSGLNRVYPPSTDFKWALRLASGFPVAPTGLPIRLAHILRGDPTQAVADARRLIDETIALVDLHRPDIDTASIRDRVSQTRPG